MTTGVRYLAIGWLVALPLTTGLTGCTSQSEIISLPDTTETDGGTADTHTGAEVQGEQIFFDGVPETVAGYFETAETSTDIVPIVVYPEDGAVIPPNLRLLEFHFDPGSSRNDTFQITFETSKDTIVVYTGCGEVENGCAYLPDETVWSALASQSRGGQVSYRIRGLNSDDPAEVGVSRENRITTATEDIKGGIYYWNAGAGAIVRYDFGLNGQSPERFIDSDRADGSCVGCHAVSRNGKRIAVGLDQPAGAAVRVFDIADRAQLAALEAEDISRRGDGQTDDGDLPEEGELPEDGLPGAGPPDDGFPGDGPAEGGNPDDGPPGLPGQDSLGDGPDFAGLGAPTFLEFSPDAEQLAVSRKDGIQIVAADGGDLLATIANANFTMPTWSPSGDLMVVVERESGGPGVSGGSLVVLSRTGDGFERAQTLVASSGDNNFYPAFSPDGSYVLYNYASSNAPSMSIGAEGTGYALRVVSVTGGEPIELRRSSSDSDKWPKWDPSSYEHNGHPLYWFAFSSKRAYGLRIESGVRSQIWMAAFDPTKVGAGEDPSSAAFWLPFQDIESGNHVAQFVTEVARQACTGDSECGDSEICYDSACVEESGVPF